MESVTFIIVLVLFASLVSSYLIIKLFKKKKKATDNIEHLEANEKTNKVVRIYIQELVKNPNNNKIRYRLAVLLERLGRNKDAINEYLNLMHLRSAQNSSSGFDYITENKILLGSKIGYEEVMGLEILQKLEELSNKIMDKENAFRFFIMLYNNDPENKEYIKKMGLILLQEGYPKLAKPYLEYLMEDNADMEVMRSLVYIYTQMKEYHNAADCIENINKYTSKKSKIKDSLEHLQLSFYIIAEEYVQSKMYAEHLLSNKKIDVNLVITRAYVFILYKMSKKDVFLKQYIDYKESVLASRKDPQMIIDIAFYSYFLGELENSIKYFKLVEDIKSLFDIDIKSILEYLEKMAKIDHEYKVLEKSIRLKVSQREKVEHMKNLITDNDREFWDYSIDSWESSICSNLSEVKKFCIIKPTFDIKLIIKEEGFQLKPNSVIRKEKKVNQIEKIFNLSFTDFTNICQSIVRYKLKYFIDQEITDKINPEDSGDGINYLAYEQKTGRAELTLISFRRWDTEVVGELVLRDFTILMNDVDVKKGILLIPVELTKSASTYAINNPSVEVYAKWKFNNLLIGEKL